MGHEAVPSDTDLAAKARAGDARALADLFERHRRTLEARARGLMAPAVRRKVSIADVVQEAHIAATHKVGAFENRGNGAMRAWLLRIVELKAREAVRRYGLTAKRNAGREVSRSGRLDADGFAARGLSPSEGAMASELKARAERALSGLSEDHQRVLHLTRVEGLTLAEAAERMGRTREAAKKLYGRALSRFTQALGLPGMNSRG